MVAAFLLVFLFCFAICLAQRGGHVVSDCEKACGPGLNASQKSKLCSHSGSIGPGQCAFSAKGLHLSGDDVVNLCQHAGNDAPAECMSALSASDRKRYGMELCSGAVSSIQHECFNMLTASPFRGTHALPVTEVLEFCKDIEDGGALACMQAIPDAGLGPVLSAKLGLLPTACRQSTLYVYPAGTSRNVTTGKPILARETRSLPRILLDSLTFWRSGLTPNKTPGFMEDVVGKHLAVLACLEELKHTFSASTSQTDRFGAKETLEFCMHSSTRTMAPDSILPRSMFLGERLDRLEQTKRHLEPEYFRNYLSECAIRMGHVKSSPKSNRKMFTAAQRLQICEGIDTHNGPYNCAFSLVSTTTKDVLQPEDIVSLCSGAGGIDRDSEVQLRADARKEEIRVKKLRSSDKREREAAHESKRHVLVNSHRSLGLGPALCFLESRSIGISIEERIELCAGAEGSGPALCYKKAASALRVATHSEKLMLCVGAESPDPAECAQAGPHYLSMAERIHVCSGAPRDRASEPVRCLQAIETPSRLFKDAPKRSIGSFSVHIRSPEESASRDLLIHMCSFDGSKQPLAAAECLKSAPPALSHDSVVRTCTNTSTADLFSRVGLCQRLLPRDWTLEEATALCNYSDNSEADDPLEAEINAKAEAEVAAEEGRPPRQPNKKSEKTPASADDVRATTTAVVRCAVDLNGYHTYRPVGIARDGLPNDSAAASIGSWSRAEASVFCRKEQASGALRMCGVGAKPTATMSASHNAQFINPTVISSVCHAALSDSANFSDEKRANDRVEAAMAKASACLSRLASSGSRGIAFAEGVAQSICGAADPPFVLTCLEESHSKRSRIEFSHVHDCLNQPKVIERAQFASLQSTDGAPFITAGARFSLSFDLVDQYGVPFRNGANTKSGPLDSCAGESESDDFLVQISINEGNEQGSVLWGSRTNTTSCGSIVFGNLVLTQPGAVTFKLESSLRRISEVSDAKSKLGQRKILAVATYHVRANPEAGSASGRCLFLFREGLCDSYGALEGRIKTPENENSDSAVGGTVNTRMYLPVTFNTYLKFLTCTPTFEHWHVDWHATSTGFWADFRTGIDAIWTGHGLPRDDMQYTDVLELPRDIIDQAVQAASTIPPKGEHDAAEADNKASRGEGTKRTGKAAKAIRRAYYRKSLQWHPDRWVGMSIYSLIVKSAFEIVTQAHDNLQRILEQELALVNAKKSVGKRESEELTPDPVFA